jgi:hypothetical protein
LFERESVKRFANDYLEFVVKDIGLRATFSANAVSCDEADWNGLEPWAAARGAVSASDWKRMDAFSFSLALKQDPTGSTRRASEAERLEELVQSRWKLEFAKLLSPYDIIVLLRDARLGSQARRLMVTANQVVQSISRLQEPSDAPAKRIRFPQSGELYKRFEASLGEEEFRRRYLGT